MVQGWASPLRNQGHGGTGLPGRATTRFSTEKEARELLSSDEMAYIRAA
jgi:hypothetical protein